MRLTLIHKNKLNVFLLPEEINGSYSIISDDNGKKANLLSVEAKDGSWFLISNQEVFVMNNENLMVPFVKLQNDSFYLIKNSNKDEQFYIYASPTVEPNYREFAFEKKKVLAVGSGEKCDICYQLGGVPEKAFEISTTESGHYINICDNSTSVYINNSRIVNQTYFEYGDVIFMFGLRLILMKRDGVDYFLVNNPNNLLKFEVGFTNILAVPNTFVDKGEELLDDAVYGDDNYFYRTPYFHKELDVLEFKIDNPPQKKDEEQPPYILTIGPMLTMSLTSMVRLFDVIDQISDGTRTWGQSIPQLVTVFTMLASSILWPFVTRVVTKKIDKRNEKKRQKLYLKYLDEKDKEIEEELTRQRMSMLEDYLTVTGCQNIILGRDIRLWQRRITDPDFLAIPVGIGNKSMKVNIIYPEKHFSLSEDNLVDSVIELGTRERIMKDVPIVFSFKENVVTGVVGDSIITKAFMDRIMLQLMAQYSYDELKIVSFISSTNSSDYEYLKNIPHSWSNDRTIRYYGSTREEYNEICYNLEQIYNERESKNTTEEETASPNTPHFVIITDSIKSVGHIDFIRTLMSCSEAKNSRGFSIIILVDKIVALPNECKNFINVSAEECMIFSSVLNLDKQAFKIDFSSAEKIYDCAKTIANIPMDIKISVENNLPSSLGFLEMYQIGKIEQLNSVERWRRNNPILSLSAPLGVGNNGDLVNLDLHEKYHGPHGLIAGTTGSGKSEFIVTYVLSMAVNFSPDEVQFVLIDYKGGGLAMSFENEELGIRLPHIAGTITNLDKSEINRAISSIESELKRRQSVFNETRERLKEGSMNIYKYQQFYRKGMVKEPMSHLLIICDEFAELKQQQPEFMDQLISTSRIGRSLGVHLILATQKPSGVVNDQIWSNSKFKVCLKVQDVSDSQGILKKPDAAYLKDTGRFYLQVGYDSIFTLGQAAWAGTKYFPSDAVKKNLYTRIEYIDNIGRTVNYYEDEKSQVNVENKGEELLNIVKYLSDITKNYQFVKRQLWLENVKPVSYLANLVKKYNHVAKPLDYTIPFGEYDEPRRQEQGLLTVDLAKGNIAIVGQPGSGKEMLISTILWSSMIEHTPYEINHYIVDYGAETLKKFVKFPHVGEVVFQSEPDNFAGVLQIIMDAMEERKKLFQEYNGSFEYYNSVAQKKLPLLVLTINGYDVLSELIPKAVDLIGTLFRDAPRYGIIFIVSASSSTALRQRQLQYFQRLIVLQMQDETVYRSMTNCRRGLIPGHYIGRGICKLNDDDDSTCEFQTASIVSEDKQQDYIKAVAEQLIKYYKVKAKQLAVIPDDVTSADLIKYITTLDNVPIGFNFYEKDITKFNLLKNKINLITSKNLNADIGFLYALTGILSKVPNVKVRVIDMLEIFSKPILDIKMFNEDLDAVIAAIEKDVLTRTVTQDYGINIIIGAGQFKKKLSKAGVEIWNNLFNHIAASNKSIFILVDNYEKMRNLKLETWFNLIDTSSGIWLGQGFSSQSLFVSDELTIDDKKLDYPNMAYVVNNGKYTLIKSMCDEDE